MSFQPLQVQLDTHKIEEGELDAHEQAYLNDLLQDNNPILSKFIKNKSSPNDDVVELYLMNSINKIQQQLDNGKLQFSSSNGKSIVKSKQRIAEIQLRRKALEKELGYLNTQMHSYQQQSKPHLSTIQEISKKQHHRLIKKMFKLHEEFKRNHQKNLHQMEEKMKEEEIHKKQEEEEKLQIEKQQKRKRIQQKLNQLKDIQQRRKSQAEESNARMEEIKHKKFLYEKMEEKYEKDIVLPILEMKKKKLKELREFRRPLSIQELKNHEQQYMKLKQTLAHQIKKAHPKYQPPGKSSRLERLLEEQEKEKQKEIEQKKRYLEEKIQRAQSYSLYLKQNFKPRIDEDKKREIQQRLQRQKSKTRQEVLNRKEIGLDHLQYSKRRHKILSSNQRNSRNSSVLESGNFTHRQRSQQTASVSSQDKTNSLKKHNYLTIRDKKYYEQERNRKLERIIENRDLDKNEKVQELKVQAERLSEMASRKDQLSKVRPNEQNEQEATQLLLASIRAKMGIIDIYKSKE